VIEESRSGARSIPLTDGSGSGSLSTDRVAFSSPYFLFYGYRAMQCGVYICFDETLYPNRGYGYGFRIFIKGMLHV
jgi:hypothetical protein